MHYTPGGCIIDSDKRCELEAYMKEMRGNRSRRGVALVAVVAASVVAFASLGGVGLAQSAVGLAQYQYGKKVTICHKGKNTIRISTRAWPAHKRHGDTLGTCAAAKKKAHAKAEHAKKGKSGGEHGKNPEQSSTPAAAPTSGNDKGNGQSGKSKDKGGKHQD
jgi:hypothetical protein